MLKKFFLNVLSSFVGTWIAMASVLLAIVVVAVALVAKFDFGTDVSVVSKHSVLVLDLDGVISETETATSLSPLQIAQGEIEKPRALNLMVEGLKQAANNSSIDALYIKCKNPSAGPATFNALRDAVLEFKASGKKVYAYGDNFTLGTYLVASAADKVWLNPGGSISITGLGSQSLYLKGLFDKVGVEFEVVKVGTYKSAVEPYTQTTMSEPARAQLDTLFTQMWARIRSEVGESRKSVTPAKLNDLVNAGLAIDEPTKVEKNGLVDGLLYERQVDEKIADYVGVEKEDLNYVAPETLAASSSLFTSYTAKRQIAVLYAEGEIVDGGTNAINYETLVPIITDLADNEDVKGMVLRVNSPGGSVFGSQQIGDALDYFMSKGKPLAVSMGDYAASGGYWISAKANMIFADPLTVTGSIGIFGLIPNYSKLLDKLGVATASVSTNPDVNVQVPYRPLTPKQKELIQASVNRGYDQFVNRVAEGRKMKRADVLRLAEGRVWSAMAAEKLGLVDKLGSLQDAVEWTAKKAKCENYDVAVYPQYEPSVWDWLPTEALQVSKSLSEDAQPDLSHFALWMMKRVVPRNHVVARMPEYMVITLN